MDNIELADLKETIEQAKNKIKIMEVKKQYNEAAMQLHNAYDSFKDNGFTEDQAWWLTATMFSEAFKNGARR